MRLSIRDLMKQYEKGVVFGGAGYTFEEGNIYGIVGAPNSGKTTLFDCISGEVDYSGSIELEIDGNTVLPGLDTVGVSFQTPMVPEFLTGYEYIRYFIDTHPGGHGSDYTVEEYLSLVGLPQNMWGILIRDYSTDYKNRLQLAGIFIAGSPVVLLDEPVLDTPVDNWERLRDLLNAFKPGRIILLATEVEEVAEEFCDEIVFLEMGRFVRSRRAIKPSLPQNENASMSDLLSMNEEKEDSSRKNESETTEEA